VAALGWGKSDQLMPKAMLKRTMTFQQTMLSVSDNLSMRGRLQETAPPWTVLGMGKEILVGATLHKHKAAEK
jgi:hypothetical protein